MPTIPTPTAIRQMRARPAAARRRRWSGGVGRLVASGLAALRGAVGRRRRQDPETEELLAWVTSLQPTHPPPGGCPPLSRHPSDGHRGQGDETAVDTGADPPDPTRGDDTSTTVRRPRPRPRVWGVSIDPPGTPAPEDAVRAWPTGNGWLLQVSVADLAAAVPPGSPAATRALRRGLANPAGRSLVEPEVIARCALGPGRLRRTLTVSVPVGADGAIGVPAVALTVLSGHARLTYRHAHQVLGDPGHPLHRELVVLWTVAARLQRARAAPGPASADGSGRDRDPAGAVPSLHASEVVAECMIAANRAVGARAAAHRLPVLYRNQLARPAPSRTPGTPRAVYGPHPRGHAELRTGAYAQVTSPFRRLGDLINQWALHALVAGQPAPLGADALTRIGDRLTRLERASAARTRSATGAARLRTIRQATRMLYGGTAAAISPRVFSVLLGAHTARPLQARLAGEIRRRLEAGTLPPRDVVTVCLAPTDPSWRRLNPSVLAWLWHRRMAEPVLEDARRALGWPPPAVEFVAASPAALVAARAQIRRDGRLLGGLWAAAATPERARRLALVSLLDRLLGQPVKPLAARGGAAAATPGVRAAAAGGDAWRPS